jgi:hypothetical protein
MVGQMEGTGREEVTRGGSRCRRRQGGGVEVRADGRDKRKGGDWSWRRWRRWQGGGLWMGGQAGMAQIWRAHGRGSQPHWAIGQRWGICEGGAGC